MHWNKTSNSTPTSPESRNEESLSALWELGTASAREWCEKAEARLEEELANLDEKYAQAIAEYPAVRAKLTDKLNEVRADKARLTSAQSFDAQKRNQGIHPKCEHQQDER